MASRVPAPTQRSGLLGRDGECALVDADGQIRHHRFGEGEHEHSEIIIQLLLRAAGAERVSRDLVSVDARGIETPAEWDEQGSGETHLGYARATNFASPGGASRDRPQEHALPDSLHVNRWAIAGDWTIRRQAAVLNAAGGRTAHRFHARDPHVVMAPGPAGRPVRSRVLLAGEPPGSAHRVHTDARGNGSVAEPRLYQLVRQRGRVTDQTFESPSSTPGPTPTCSPSDNAQ